jgi:hypothetical protein
MLGLTSIDLPFYGNLRSNWVVVIGLELLSHACPGLDLGVVIMLLHISMLPLSLLWLFDPISVGNRIWGDGNGICWCDADGSRLCPVRWWKHVASYHTQI